jgi:DNA-binding NarL/FixJ family response regulator
MEHVRDSIVKGLLAVLTLTLSNEHLLRADETNKMLLIGVLTVLTLAFSPEQLINTVKEVTNGSSTINGDLLNDSILAENFMKTIQSIPNRKETQSTISPLTPREREVLSLMADGLMNKEIAKKIGLREGTVKCHVNSIFHKLNVNVRTEAVVFAIKSGFINVNNTMNIQNSANEI